MVAVKSFEASVHGRWIANVEVLLPDDTLLQQSGMVFAGHCSLGSGGDDAASVEEVGNVRVEEVALGL